MANYFNRGKNVTNRHRVREKVVADNSEIKDLGGGYIALEGTVTKVQGSKIQVSVSIIDKARNAEKIYSVNAYLCGKLKMFKIRIIEHDVVILAVLAKELMNSDGKINGRITQRKDGKVEDPLNPINAAASTMKKPSDNT